MFLLSYCFFVIVLDTGGRWDEVIWNDFIYERFSSSGRSSFMLLSVIGGLC